MMTFKKVLIWGTGGHAMVVADALLAAGEVELVGFIDDVYIDRIGCELMGFPVLGDSNDLSRIRAAGVEHFIVGIGDCSARLSLSAKSKALGFSLITVVHPSAAHRANRNDWRRKLYRCRRCYRARLGFGRKCHCEHLRKCRSRLRDRLGFVRRSGGRAGRR